MAQALVLQLQEEASTGSIPLPDVLRKARMVATKLSLVEMNTWIGYELHGYPQGVEVPEYRVLHGDVRAHNPYNGYLMPVRFKDPDLQDTISKIAVRQSIGSLAEVLASDSEFLQVPFPERQLAHLREAFGPEDREWLIPFRKIGKPHLAAVFDAVRNRILDWTLKLEREGILGEGLKFSEKEREASQHVVFNISNSSIDQLNSSGTNVKGRS